jgi:hypothetical protein
MNADNSQKKKTLCARYDPIDRLFSNSLKYDVGYGNYGEHVPDYSCISFFSNFPHPEHYSNDVLQALKFIAN